jgi:hypothetical protein
VVHFTFPIDCVIAPPGRKIGGTHVAGVGRHLTPSFRRH